MGKTVFHTIRDEDIKDLVKGAYLLEEVDTYSETGQTHIPLFRFAPVKGFDARKWRKPKKVVTHVILGREEPSFVIFIVTNRYNETMKFALPMDNYVMLLSVILMAKEIRLAPYGADVSTKGAREKSVVILKLEGETYASYVYGLTLYMDVKGLIKHPESKAIREENSEQENNAEVK